jgi:hypothetical protein
MTLCEKQLAAWSTMTERETTDLECVGVSPWGDAHGEGVWCWDADADEVLIGTCLGDAEIVCYAEAIRRG